MNKNTSCGWTPPVPSMSSRTIGLKSKGSLRGSLVTADRQPRRVQYESALEKKVALVLLARLDVSDVREQPQACEYVDRTGATRSTTFDFMVTMTDGARVAVAVKPRSRAERHDLAGTLSLIASQVGADFADRLVLMTEDDVPRDVVHTAALLHAVKRDPLSEADGAVAAIVGTLSGSTTVGEIVAASGLRGAAFRAVARLIGSGTLTVVDGCRLTYGTSVRRTEERSR